MESPSANGPSKLSAKTSVKTSLPNELIIEVCKHYLYEALSADRKELQAHALEGRAKLEQRFHLDSQVAREAEELWASVACLAEHDGKRARSRRLTLFCC